MKCLISMLIMAAVVLAACGQEKKLPNKYIAVPESPNNSNCPDCPTCPEQPKDGQPPKETPPTQKPPTQKPEKPEPPCPNQKPVSPEGPVVPPQDPPDQEPPDQEPPGGPVPPPQEGSWLNRTCQCQNSGVFVSVKIRTYRGAIIYTNAYTNYGWCRDIRTGAWYQVAACC